MTREEALEGSRTIWKECPTEENYIKWWWNTNSPLCEYHKKNYPVSRCPLQVGGHSICEKCAPELDECYDAVYNHDYPAFAIAFQAMHDRIYSLTVDDLEERK